MTLCPIWIGQTRHLCPAETNSTLCSYGRRGARGRPVVAAHLPAFEDLRTSGPVLTFTGAASLRSALGVVSSDEYRDFAYSMGLQASRTMTTRSEIVARIQSWTTRASWSFTHTVLKTPATGLLVEETLELLRSVWPDSVVDVIATDAESFRHHPIANHVKFHQWTSAWIPNPKKKASVRVSMLASTVTGGPAPVRILFEQADLIVGCRGRIPSGFVRFRGPENCGGAFRSNSILPHEVVRARSICRRVSVRSRTFSVGVSRVH